MFAWTGLTSIVDHSTHVHVYMDIAARYGIPRLSSVTSENGVRSWCKISTFHTESVNNGQELYSSMPTQCLHGTEMLQYMYKHGALSLPLSLSLSLSFSLLPSSLPLSLPSLPHSYIVSLMYMYRPV